MAEEYKSPLHALCEKAAVEMVECEIKAHTSFIYADDFTDNSGWPYPDKVLRVRIDWIDASEVV